MTGVEGFELVFEKAFLPLSSHYTGERIASSSLITLVNVSLQCHTETNHLNFFQISPQ